MYSEKRERSRCLIDLGIVCSILLESRRFFSAQRESRFCISLVWAAQVRKHGCEIQCILTRSTVESSAQRTLTVIGSPGMQANASAKVPPTPMRLIEQRVGRCLRASGVESEDRVFQFRDRTFGVVFGIQTHQKRRETR